MIDNNYVSYEETELEKKYTELKQKYDQLQKQHNDLAQKYINSQIQNETKILNNNNAPIKNKKKYSATSSDSNSYSDSDSDSYSDSSSDSSSESEDEPVNPPMEKKPLSGYMLFASQKRNEVIKNNPSFKVVDVAKKLGEMWNKLSDDEREYYKPIKPIIDPKEEKKPMVLPKVSPPVILPMEKKPLSGYMLFAYQKREEVVKNNPSLKVTEVAKKIGELWLKLSDDEKAIYKK